MLNVFKNKLSQIHKQSKEAKELLRFIGPGILVTVGFIDPGNWAANLVSSDLGGRRRLRVCFAVGRNVINSDVDFAAA